MNARLAFSWLFLIAGGAMGAHFSYTGQVPTDPLVSALTWGYIAWALYWGVPVVFRWWCKLDVGDDWKPRLFKFFLGCGLVPLLGYAYGALGGGLYQFFKTWWLART